MPLLIRPATTADAPLLTEIYLSAFTHDSISKLVFPRNASTTSFWTNSILDEISDPHAHFLCVVDTDTSTPPSTSSGPSSPPEPNSRIIAYAKYNSPSSPLPNPDTLPKWPEGADTKIADHFFGSLLRKHGEVMGERKHWYLEILCTREEDQGKGAGGMLLRWGLERADEEGVELFLEASPAGVPVYKKYGFEEVGNLKVDLRGKNVDEDEFEEVTMVRKARAKTNNET